MSVAIGWWLISAGFLTGAVFGLLAQSENWLGGYASRTRRLLRLGHIALIALGALNVVWPLTTTARDSSSLTSIITGCFVVGGLTMGPVCFLSAMNWRCRVGFIIPSTALIVGAVLAGWESFP
jgi:hypothetical protein